MKNAHWAGVLLTVLGSGSLNYSIMASPAGAQNSQIDVPFCYMQTPDGRTVNLGNLCRGQTPSSPTQSCNANSTAKPQLTLANVNYDGDFLTGNIVNQSCKTVKYVKVNYEVLDEAGNLIDNGYIYTQPSALGPGQSATFKGPVVSGATVQATHAEWSE